MSNYYDSIINYLKSKKETVFTGVIKLSFELGELVSLSEYNAFDTPTESIANKDIFKFIKECCKPDFFGSVILVYKTGFLERCGYSKTLKGEYLKTFLRGINDNLPKV